MKRPNILILAAAVAILTAPAAAATIAAPSAPAPAAAAHTGSVESDPSYRINPGDQLNVQVFGEPTLTQTVTVLDDGTIQYPLIGKVKVGGDTPTQAASTITKSLEEYVKHPIVTVGV